MKKILRITTVPISLMNLLKGQPKFMSQYYKVVGVTSPGDEIDTIIKGEELPPVPENGKGEELTKSEESAEEVPEHVKEMIEKRKNKDTAPKDDSN